MVAGCKAGQEVFSSLPQPVTAATRRGEALVASARTLARGAGGVFCGCAPRPRRYSTGHAVAPDRGTRIARCASSARPGAGQRTMRTCSRGRPSKARSCSRASPQARTASRTPPSNPAVSCPLAPPSREQLPDVMWVLPQSEAVARGIVSRADLEGAPSREIRVDEVRALSRRLALAAARGRRKVAVLAPPRRSTNGRRTRCSDAGRAAARDDLPAGQRAARRALATCAPR